jgi:hypothetical protein
MPIMTFWAKEPFPRKDSLRYSDHQIPICTPKTPCKPWPRNPHFQRRSRQCGNHRRLRHARLDDLGAPRQTNRECNRAITKSARLISHAAEPTAQTGFRTIHFGVLVINCRPFSVANWFAA